MFQFANLTQKLTNTIRKHIPKDLIVFKVKLCSSLRKRNLRWGVYNSLKLLDIHGMEHLVFLPIVSCFVKEMDSNCWLRIVIIFWENINDLQAIRMLYLIICSRNNFMLNIENLSFQFMLSLTQKLIFY